MSKNYLTVSSLLYAEAEHNANQKRTMPTRPASTSESDTP